MTVSQAVWKTTPAEFSAQQVYAPASSGLTFDKDNTSISTPWLESELLVCATQGKRREPQLNQSLEDVF